MQGLWIQPTKYVQNIQHDPYLHVTVVHVDPLEVEQAGRLEHLPPQHPDVVASHPQYLDLVMEVGGDGGEAGVGAVRLALPVGPLAVAGRRALVAGITGSLQVLEDCTLTTSEMQ